MNTTPAGYLEVDHTADCELKAWAPDISTLFEQVALGMYSLAGASLQAEPRISRQIELQDSDRESLLVGFLSELLYLCEIERLGFDTFDISIEKSSLQAKLDGGPLKALSKEIKAVTYHDLEIEAVPGGYKVSIVFDV